MQRPTFRFPPIPRCGNPLLENRIQARLDNLTKPRGSLGRLEECALRYLMCRGSADERIRHLELFTFAADHGITARKITPYPKEVTAQMVFNMIGGGAAVSVMSRNAGISSLVVDMGVATDLPDHPALLKRKVAYGTADFSVGPAMTPVQCAQALQTGIEIAASSKADLIAAGEMGIGNSASAAALYALLLDLDGAVTTGEGTGAKGALLARKKRTIQKSLAFHRLRWDKTPFDALRRCGGFEIAAIAGLMIGAASHRVPIVVDGFICGAAALAAMRIDPRLSRYLFFSHVSDELFHRSFLRQAGIVPLLDLKMRLGEGTGAVLAMQIIRQALSCYHEMATFGSASVSREVTAS
ncbi:MAG: nicotinate-nucleotide--dimethylbenzimidazole phosphoribosyltransferase [Chitinispirillaceae bacterium]|nr:nicotinate-nucleotide--dimethylbenzimidazole phosphoribosyltransferase [Chitinispirillaceae bacterium]